jgi:hypothetical protein
MSGKTNRTRGHTFEREMAASYRDIFPKCCTARYGSREADEHGIDLCHTDGFAFQCKRVKRLSVQKYLEEIDSEDMKVVLMRADKSEPVVLMYKEDFDKLIWLGVVGNAVLNDHERKA